MVQSEAAPPGILWGPFLMSWACQAEKVLGWLLVVVGSARGLVCRVSLPGWRTQAWSFLCRGHNHWAPAGLWHMATLLPSRQDARSFPGCLSPRRQPAAWQDRPALLSWEEPRVLPICNITSSYSSIKCRECGVSMNSN